eukprot:NODE_7707_length_425_cov_170.354054.p1 GENE.NODE_7707_length_425_cov_170.354054~~NODE_7707_length_425_cov_170.354054.p1  ORF type:complete len:90 (+),score=33.92 NODE_7707_length_425_cov_170.354054:18-287(+)
MGFFVKGFGLMNGFALCLGVAAIKDGCSSNVILGVAAGHAMFFCDLAYNLFVNCKESEEAGLDSGPLKMWLVVNFALIVLGVLAAQDKK